jgi:flagellar basal body P-ring protein FlgI
MQSYRAFLLGGLLLLCGCSNWTPWKVRSQSPDHADAQQPGCRLVGDLAVPYQLYPVTIEGVGLVTGLKGTGSDPAPSPERSILLGEMQVRGVKNANAVLASDDTSLVVIRGVLRPGIQKGDRFDIEVRVPGRSETSSLRGGWLLETRLKEMAVLGDNQIRSGNVLGLAQGPILVDPSADPKNKSDQVLLCRGRILGGGVCLKSRPLSLVLKPDHKSVFNSSRIETAVNKRFSLVNNGIKVGVAEAETDQLVKLTVHPRYKDNVERYVQVIRALALKETEPERMERMRLLQKQLLEPVTTSRAALQLEAIGQQGVETLKKGIGSPDPEVRFHAAEALAYLDQSEAAAPLAEIARNQPAFRAFALAALSAMNDSAAYDQLRELLCATSAETRYGAFRALWAMNPNDPLVLGERLGDQFSYHVLDTPDPPMIHVTRSRRAEVVVFGMNQRLHPPLALEAGNHILVTASTPDEVTLSKFVPNEPDQKRVVSSRVDDVIRAIVELGGTYPDVVQALQQAKAAGALPSRLEIDSLPEGGRAYHRQASQGEDQAERGAPAKTASADRGDSREGPDAQEHPSDAPLDATTPKNPTNKKPAGLRGFFARMRARP